MFECPDCEDVGCSICIGHEIRNEDVLSEDEVTDYYDVETSWNVIHKETTVRSQS